MFKDRDLIVVAFRGTCPFDADAWCTDIDVSLYELNIEGEEERVRIHRGFMKALGLQEHRGWLKETDEVAKEGESYAYYKMKEMLRKLLEGGGTKFIVTGHSLGEALAILFVGALCMQQEDAILEKLEGVYTFGQPRVGDERFGEYMKRKIHCQVKYYYRYVYSSDPVPRLPCDGKVFGFKHFGPSLYLNCFYKGKEKEGWMQHCDHVWELIRGFIMPCVNGPAYRESWFLVLFRTLGIVFPGVSAHSPQDYVNLTRLAPKPPMKEASYNQSGL